MKQKGKSLAGMIHLYNDLIKGEKVFIGTKNKAWFLQRFKDATGAEAVFSDKPVNGDNLYLIKLKN